MAPTARATKDRRRLRRSSTIAGVGDGVVAAALPLLAVDLTRDPVAIATVVAAQHLPWVLVEALWPRLHLDRRTVVGLVDTVRALVLGALGVLVVEGHQTMLQIQLVAFVVGLGEALTDGTEAETTDVGGLSSRAMVGMAIVGLPLGGILFEVFPATPFLFEVLVFAGAALFALLVGRPVRPPVVQEEAFPKGDAGGRTAWLTAAAALASLAAAAAAGILVLYAHDDLGLGAPAFGLLLAGLAVATTVGGVAAPVVGERLGVQRALVIALVVAAAGDVAASRVAHPDRPLAGAAALGVTAAAAMVASILTRAAFQLQGGRRLDGAALHRFHLIVWGAIPVGALAAGWLARHRSVHEVLAWAGGAWLLGLVAVAGNRLTARANP